MSIDTTFLRRCIATLELALLEDRTKPKFGRPFF